MTSQQFHPECRLQRQLRRGENPLSRGHQSCNQNGAPLNGSVPAWP